MNCVYCGKETDGVNYCSYQCHIDEAKQYGGKVIAPNNLPILCIKHDWTMLENENADHPTYKYPVEVEYIGVKEELPDWDNSYDTQAHALIYNDENIAITLYESTYSMFRLNDGKTCFTDFFWDIGQWRLTRESLKKIKI